MERFRLREGIGLIHASVVIVLGTWYHLRKLNTAVAGCRASYGRIRCIYTAKTESWWARWAFSRVPY